jgi:hypothetical protein
MCKCDCCWLYQLVRSAYTQAGTKNTAGMRGVDMAAVAVTALEGFMDKCDTCDTRTSTSEGLGLDCGWSGAQHFETQQNHKLTDA